MAPTEYDKKPEPGDLIEIFRGGYQHWAIYVGDGFVIHLVPPSESANAGAYISMMSVTCDRAAVKKEGLWDVVGNDECCINNLLDDKYESFPITDIIQIAQIYLGKKLPYSVISWNCEHFVTNLRYGKPESRQVRRALQIGAGAVFGKAALGALIYAMSAKTCLSGLIGKLTFHILQVEVAVGAGLAIAAIGVLAYVGIFGSRDKQKQTK